MSDEHEETSLKDRFFQPVEDIEIVSKSGSGTLLTPDAIKAGRTRVALGEKVEDVAMDLVMDELMLVLNEVSTTED